MPSGHREETVDITRMRISARLEVGQHHAERSDDTKALEKLLRDATNALGQTDALVFQIECAVEEVRSKQRGASESALTWQRLQERAAAHLSSNDPVLMRIRSFEAQYTRRRGDSGDSDRGIAMYREELQRRVEVLGDLPYRSRMTRGNLAFALLERGRREDLREALGILLEEVEHRTARYGADTEFTGLAQGNLGRTLLRLHEEDEHAEEGLPAQALAIADKLIDARRRRFGRSDSRTLTAHLLRAHALLLLDDLEAARTEVRYVRAFVTSRGVHVETGWLNELTRRLTP